MKPRKIIISLKLGKVLVIKIDNKIYIAKDIIKIPGSIGEELHANLYKI